MGKQELYSLIFTDSFVANIAFCFSSEIAFEAAKVFNNYNMAVIIAVASFASIFAYMINYIFGQVIFRMLAPMQKESGKANTKLFRKLSENIFFKIMLALSAMTIYGKFAIFFAGFAGINARFIILLSVIMRPIYYLYILLF